MNLKSYRVLESKSNYYMSDSLKQIDQKMVIYIDNAENLSSDLYFRIKHKGNFKNKLICRFAINPAFVLDK